MAQKNNNKNRSLLINSSNKNIENEPLCHDNIPIDN